MNRSGPPAQLGAGRVLYFAHVSETVRPTGAAVHTVDGRVLGPVACLAICEWPGTTSCFLYYCTDAWEILTDTWHESIALARRQAEFEYEGISACWQRLGCMS
jgi:hypothetical protein